MIYDHIYFMEIAAPTNNIDFLHEIIKKRNFADSILRKVSKIRDLNSLILFFNANENRINDAIASAERKSVYLKRQAYPSYVEKCPDWDAIREYEFNEEKILVLKSIEKCVSIKIF